MTTVAQVVPWRAQQVLKSIYRGVRLRSAVSRLRASLRSGGVPSAADLSALIYGWGNEAWSAEAGLLQAIVDEVDRSQPGHVLECGTGVSTLLLGLLSEGARMTFWSLEHDSHWHAYTAERMARLRVPTKGVLLAPMRRYDGFDWYDAAAHALPDRFDVIICDGPPGSTRGGRFGLVPVLRDRIAAGTRIIVDDAHRPDEQEIVRRWSSEFDLRFATQRETDQFLVLRVVGS